MELVLITRLLLLFILEPEDTACTDPRTTRATTPSAVDTATSSSPSFPRVLFVSLTPLLPLPSSSTLPPYPLAVSALRKGATSRWSAPGIFIGLLIPGRSG